MQAIHCLRKQKIEPNIYWETGLPFEASYFVILRRTGWRLVRHSVSNATAEEWRGLVDSFRNGEVIYDFPLNRIQTVFSEFGINVDI